jgi:hypothetical protein
MIRIHSWSSTYSGRSTVRVYSRSSFPSEYHYSSFTIHFDYNHYNGTDDPPSPYPKFKNHSKFTYTPYKVVHVCPTCHLPPHPLFSPCTCHLARHVALMSPQNTASMLDPYDTWSNHHVTHGPFKRIDVKHTSS